MFTKGFVKTAGFDIEKADKEISAKPLHQIQKDTAYTWGSRGIAAYKKYLDTKKLPWLFDGDEYYHESVEHAALVESKNPKVLKDVQKYVGAFRERAHNVH